MTLTILADQRFGFGVAQVPDALLRLEVELDPVALVLGVDEAEGVAAEAVHVAVSRRNAPVAHHDGDLVQRFRQRGPEIPVVLGAAQIGARVALDGVVEVREFQRIAQEKDRRVIADHVPIALFGIKLDREAANIALGVRRATLAGHGGEARKQLGLLADLGENFGAGVLGDVMGDGERPIGAGTFGVHPPFGDDFAIKMGEFFQKPDILQQLRAAWPGGHDVLVINDGAAGVGGEGFLLGHDQTPAKNAGEVACKRHYCKK